VEVLTDKTFEYECDFLCCGEDIIKDL